MYPEATRQQLDFAENICVEMYMSMVQNDEKIHVVPARCGFGKGNTQKVFLNHLQDAVKEFLGKPMSPMGVIFVTDRKARLEELYKFENIAQYSYWLQAESDCKIPLMEQFVEQQNYPVLMMTTQRYFQMDTSAIRALKKWKNEEGEWERTLVIFDEKPYFLQSLDLNDDMLNRVENALFHLPEELMFLDEEELETKNISKNNVLSCFVQLKQDVFHEWEELTEFLKDNSEKRYTWLPPQEEEPSSSEFYEMIKKIGLSDDVRNAITAIRRRKKNGCFYVNNKTGTKQNRYYKIPMDNLSKFLTEDFSYWVFDATAYNDIEYELLADRLPFELYEVDDTKEENSKATHLVYNTSKANMAVAEKAKPVIEYANDCPASTLIITYKNIEQKINRRKPECRTMHFGDTKGYNDYKDVTEFLQIGVNRQDDLYYFSTYLELYPKEMEKINTLSPDDILIYIEQITWLERGNFENEKIQNIMLSKIATDFEQNIFRTKLRQFGSSDEVNIKIICAKEYKKAISPVLRRYGISLDVDEQTFYIEPGLRDGSHAFQILTYLASLPVGAEFTTKDIYAETGLSKHQFDKAKETHGIREILTLWRTSKGRYRKSSK